MNTYIFTSPGQRPKIRVPVDERCYKGGRGWRVDGRDGGKEEGRVAVSVYCQEVVIFIIRVHCFVCWC